MTASDRPLISKGNKLCIFVLLCLALLGQVACQGGIYVDALVPAEHEVVGEDQVRWQWKQQDFYCINKHRMQAVHCKVAWQLIPAGR